MIIEQKSIVSFFLQIWYTDSSKRYEIVTHYVILINTSISNVFQLILLFHFLLCFIIIIFLITVSYTGKWERIRLLQKQRMAYFGYLSVSCSNCLVPHCNITRS